MTTLPFGVERLEESPELSIRGVVRVSFEPFVRIAPPFVRSFGPMMSSFSEVGDAILPRCSFQQRW